MGKIISSKSEAENTNKVKLEILNDFLKDSKLTEEDVEQIGAKIKKDIAKRHTF
ncbi:MAG TPA: hypothetical protein VJK51_05055 [Candidatus Nanoarchaeia archaeon]|nr:hypothetical protein [Candidatus Nanoarchaeia archaeon]